MSEVEEFSTEELGIPSLSAKKVKRPDGTVCVKIMVTKVSWDSEKKRIDPTSNKTVGVVANGQEFGPIIFKEEFLQQCPQLRAITVLRKKGRQYVYIKRPLELTDKTETGRKRDAPSKPSANEARAPQHVTVVNYHPAWLEMFIDELALIAPVLGEQLLECYHIGSTAVPGLAAKPIIDLMVVVRDVTLVDFLQSQFEALGYEYLGEFGIAGRRYLRKGGAERTHQIHIFDLKSEHHIVRHLALRDYLRAHPAACAAYAELKRKLAAQFPYDIEGYCEGKDALVQELERQALAWYDSSWERLYLQARAVQNPRTIGAFVEAGQVAAAFLTRSGAIFTGVCLDTACSLGMCAERNAIGSMLTAGESDMTRLVVVMPGGALGLPCGACRELMMQLDANELEILTGREPVQTVTLSALVPQWWGS